MPRVVIGGDSGSGTESDCLKLAENAFKKNNYSVVNTGVGPNLEGRIRSVGTLASEDVLVFFVNGAGICTPISFYDAFASKVKKIYFAYPLNGNSSTTPNGLKNKFSKGNGGEVEWSSYHANFLKKRGMSGHTSVHDFFNNSSISPKMGYVCGEKSCGKLAEKIIDDLKGSHSGSDESTTQETDQKSGLLSGEYTFQELISEICNGIDLLFLCKRNTVVVTDVETLYSEAQYLRKKGISKSEDINLWQLEDGSYELNVDQYGFYNTVNVVYKNGVWKEQFSDLVDIYGEVSITYTHKNFTKEQAKQQAKTYLAAHLREFNMEINASILHDGSIDIGDIVTLENPLTLRDSRKNNSELLFVKGLGVSWEGDTPITCDLELQYAPESPESPEIPTTGTTGYKTQGETDKDCWDKWWEFAYKSVWSWGYNVSDPSDPKACYNYYKNKKGTKKWDCFSSSSFLYYVLNFLCKVPTRVVVAHSDSSNSGTHRCVQCKIDNKWEFPSEYDNMGNGLKVSDPMRSGKYKVFRKEPSDLNNPKSYPNRISGLI